MRKANLISRFPCGPLWFFVKLVVVGIRNVLCCFPIQREPSLFFFSFLISTIRCLIYIIGFINDITSISKISKIRFLDTQKVQVIYGYP